MRDKRNWSEAIIAGVGQLRYNNLLNVDGMVLAPSGGLNRYVREYLESEGGIKQKIWLRDIWESELGEKIREQLKGASYLKNIVLYELEPFVLDRIVHQLMMTSPKLVLSLVGNRRRIVHKKNHFFEYCPGPDSDAVPSWPS